MAHRTFNIRILIWLLVAILAVIVAWRWFGPAPVATFAPLPEPAAPVAHSAEPATTPPVDALWARYQQLKQMDASSSLQPSMTDTTDTAIATDQSTSVQISAEDEKRQRRAEQQLEREQRVTAIYSAQNELNQTLSKAKPGDTQVVIGAMEQFDQSLRQAGVNNPVDMNSLKTLLVTADKLQKLNAELLSEAGRGAKANTEKMRKLSEEIQQLLPQLQPIKVTMPAVSREDT